MLTTEEREIVNRAMGIMMGRLAENTFVMVHIHQAKGYDKAMSFTYFDSTRTQHGFVPGDTLADKLNACYEIEANMPTPETLRAEKIESLRLELAALEGGEA